MHGKQIDKMTVDCKKRQRHRHCERDKCEENVLENLLG